MNNKRDLERKEKRRSRELLKLKLKNKMDDIVSGSLEGVSKIRVSCNLNSNLADELIKYVKRDEVEFNSRTKLIEHIVEEWARRKQIL